MKVERAVAYIESQIAELQGLITDLRPAALDDLGLSPALETLYARMRDAHGLTVTSAVEIDRGPGRSSSRLDSHVESTIYRLIQEALSNTAKHAETDRASVTVTEADGQISILIQDDGQGFEPSEPARGFGLLGMRERVQLAGGTLEVASRPGAGSSASARLCRYAAPSSRRMRCRLRRLPRARLYAEEGGQREHRSPPAVVPAVARASPGRREGLGPSSTPRASIAPAANAKENGAGRRSPRRATRRPARPRAVVSSSAPRPRTAGGGRSRRRPSGSRRSCPPGRSGARSRGSRTAPAPLCPTRTPCRSQTPRASCGRTERRTRAPQRRTPAPRVVRRAHRGSRATGARGGGSRARRPRPAKTAPGEPSSRAGSNRPTTDATRHQADRQSP